MTDHTIPATTAGEDPGTEPDTQCPTDGAILDHPIRPGPYYHITLQREDTGEVGVITMPATMDIDETSCGPAIRELWPDDPDIEWIQIEVITP